MSQVIKLNDYSEEICKLGFKGLLLIRLRDVIDSEQAFEEFQNYIILNEDERMTKVLLVHKFIQHMQDKVSFGSYNEFIIAYDKAESLSEKEKVVSKILCVKDQSLKLNKVVDVINDASNREKVYNTLVKWRNLYSPQEIVMLANKMNQ